MPRRGDLSRAWTHHLRCRLPYKKSSYDGDVRCSLKRNRGLLRPGVPELWRQRHVLLPFLLSTAGCARGRHCAQSQALTDKRRRLEGLRRLPFQRCDIIFDDAPKKDSKKRKERKRAVEIAGHEHPCQGLGSRAGPFDRLVHRRWQLQPDFESTCRGQEGIAAERRAT